MLDCVFISSTTHNIIVLHTWRNIKFEFKCSPGNGNKDIKCLGTSSKKALQCKVTSDEGIVVVKGSQNAPTHTHAHMNMCHKSSQLTGEDEDKKERKKKQ